MCKLDDSKRR